jgi:hypothetical protein
MAAGGESSGKATELARRKILLDEETTSTNAPRLVYSDHSDMAAFGPLYALAFSDASDSCSK